MRKMTLLEMTQNILSSMDSDEVNNISDTVESLQVAEEIRNTFFNLYSNRDIAEFEGVIHLQAVEDTTKPNQLVVPDNVLNIKWIKYRNNRVNGTKFEDIEYLPPEEFIRRIVEMDMGSSNYLTTTLIPGSPVTYAIKNNSVPSYYTVFDKDKTLVFDSYDASLEDYLTDSNSIAWGVMSVDFPLEDSFVPPIDAGLFPHLLSEAKSLCFVNIKGVANSKEEQNARRQLVRSQTRLNITQGQREGVFEAHDYSRNRRGRSVYRSTNRRWR